MSPRRSRILAIAAACALLLGGASGCTADPQSSSDTKTPSTSAPKPSDSPSEPAAPEPIHVIGLGDLLPHDSLNANAKLPGGGYDYGQFFDGIRSELDAADVTFCNQEVPSAGTSFGISGYPTFNAPTQFAKDLRGSASCDLVNLGTNHSADKGTAGIAATHKVWDKLKPAVVAGSNRNAAEQNTVPVYEQDGVKIAFLAFAEYSNAPIDGVSLNLMSNTGLVKRLMKQAKQQADVVIVSAHWGTEDSHVVNDQQKGFAKLLAGLGADVIIGTGPHVLQSVKWVKGRDGHRTLVWYSIGNMLHTQLALDERTGLIAGFELVRDKVGGPVRVENPTGVLTYMHYDWTAAQEAANDLPARHGLELVPLADADPLLQRTRFDVTAQQQADAMAKILGSTVKLQDR